MPSKSKNKGNTWERDIARFLSDYYSESFIRTPHSGSYTGGKNAIRRNQLSESQTRSFKGDIVPPEDWIYFNSEAKFYKEFPWHQLYSGKALILNQWIAQIYSAADKGDFNILFMKFNRQGKFVSIERKHISTYPIHYMQYRDWIIVDFDIFFAQYGPLVRRLSTGSELLD